MWRGVFIFLFGGILGAAFGFAMGIFAFPYIFPPPEAREVLDTDRRGPAVAVGQFIHANPADPIHYGMGKVSVYKSAVHLEADFEVGPGPDYHVYLVPEKEIRSEAQVKAAMFVDLGRLRAFKGSQVYEIPAGLDLGKYPSVVIWCRHFQALISPADLMPAPGQQAVQ